MTYGGWSLIVKLKFCMSTIFDDNWLSKKTNRPNLLITCVFSFTTKLKENKNYDYTNISDEGQGGTKQNQIKDFWLRSGQCWYSFNFEELGLELVWKRL